MASHAQPPLEGIFPHALSLERTFFYAFLPSPCTSCIGFPALTFRTLISHGLTAHLFSAFSFLILQETFLFFTMVTFPLVFSLANIYTKLGMLPFSSPPLVLFLQDFEIHRHTHHYFFSWFLALALRLDRLDQAFLPSALILHLIHQTGSLCNNYLHMQVRYFFHDLSVSLVFFLVPVFLLFLGLVFLVLSFLSLL